MDVQFATCLEHVGDVRGYDAPEGSGYEANGGRSCMHRRIRNIAHKWQHQSSSQACGSVGEGRGIGEEFDTSGVTGFEFEGRREPALGV